MEIALFYHNIVTPTTKVAKLFVNKATILYLEK
jgi:hypothetical protein